jgi:hypothetical protein
VVVVPEAGEQHVLSLVVYTEEDVVWKEDVVMAVWDANCDVLYMIRANCFGCRSVSGGASAPPFACCVNQITNFNGDRKGQRESIS